MNRPPHFDDLIQRLAKIATSEVLTVHVLTGGSRSWREADAEYAEPVGRLVLLAPTHLPIAEYTWLPPRIPGRMLHVELHVRGPVTAEHLGELLHTLAREAAAYGQTTIPVYFDPDGGE